MKEKPKRRTDERKKIVDDLSSLCGTRTTQAILSVMQLADNHEERFVIASTAVMVAAACAAAELASYNNVPRDATPTRETFLEIVDAIFPEAKR